MVFWFGLYGVDRGQGERIARAEVRCGGLGDEWIGVNDVKSTKNQKIYI